MEFVAIDVETANDDFASICQVGIALYSDRKLVEEWKSYVDPEDEFKPLKISIHGIDEVTVEGAPTLTELSESIYRFLDDRTAVHHTHFDRTAIHQAFDKYHLRFPRCVWLDSSLVTQKAWPEFAQRGYGLENICRHLQYEYKAHDALEDAKAAAYVLHAAMEIKGLNVQGWLKCLKQPPDPSRVGSGKTLTRDGNPDGPLYGEVMVFTGTLRMPRREAADVADQIGCRVDKRVTKRTTILVVGDQDVTKLAGKPKSSNHLMAEDLIKKGQSIRIVRETDFEKMAELTE